MPTTSKAVASLLSMHPGTIGQLEALAGIDSDHAARLSFWLRCSEDARRRYRVEHETGAQVFAVAREHCHKAIAARINAGELCLCH